MGRKQSVETKRKISEWARANPRGCIVDGSSVTGRKKDPSKHKMIICPTCNNKFETLISDPKVFCQPACVRRGGLRDNSGRGKCGWYKGYYLRSTYELAYVIYCLDHNIDIQAADMKFKYFNSETQKESYYHPDFIVEGIITEIKGYKSKTVEEKKNSVGNNPYQILYKKDLIDVFKYVEQKTELKIDQLYKLYD